MRLPELIEQLRRYGDAVEQYALRKPDNPVAAPRVQRRPGRHRRLIVGIAAALMVGLVVVVLTRGNGSGSRAVRVPPRQQAPELVPTGWKPVTFGTVQFAVPQDWPVYDDGLCHEE